MGVDNTKPILNKIKRLEKIKFYHNKLKIFMKIICMKIILKSKRKWGFSWEFDKDYNEAKKKKKNHEEKMVEKIVKDLNEIKSDNCKA